MSAQTDQLLRQMSAYIGSAQQFTFDAMLETAVRPFGFAPPLADFLYRDPYRALREKVQYDVGLTDVNGKTAACWPLAKPI